MVKVRSTQKGESMKKKAEVFMRFHACKFALATAIAMTAAKAFKFLFWKFLAHRMPMMVEHMHQYGWKKAHALAVKASHAKGMAKGACAHSGHPMVGILIKLAIVFACTYLIAWLLAFLYNKFVCSCKK